jgi:hypothetical protein
VFQKKITIIRESYIFPFFKFQFSFFSLRTEHWHTQGGSCRAAPALPPPPRQGEIKKKRFSRHDVNVSRDLRFSRNQPLKSADDQYIRILKNKITELRNI